MFVYVLLGLTHYVEGVTLLGVYSTEELAAAHQVRYPGFDGYEIARAEIDVQADLHY